MKVQQQPSDEELTQFGIRFQDEEMAPFDPEDPSWNDSVFYDFYNDDGSTAGNVRIGALPNEGRVWFWLYLSARLSFEEVTALARVTRKRGTLKEGCPFFDAHSVEEFPYTSRSPTTERVMAKAVTKKTARKSPAKKRTVKKSPPRKKAVKRATKKRTTKKAAPKKAAKKRTVKKASSKKAAKKRTTKKTVKKAAKKRTSEKAALKKRAKKTTARIKKKITKAAQQAEREMEALAKLPVLEPNGQLAEAKERLKAEQKRHAAKKKKKKKQNRKRKAKKKK